MLGRRSTFWMWMRTSPMSQVSQWSTLRMGATPATQARSLKPDAAPRVCPAAVCEGKPVATIISASARALASPESASSVGEMRVFVSVFAYTFGRVHEDPGGEVQSELARLDKAEWPCFRTLARLRVLAGELALSVDHGTLIAKARSRAARLFLESGADVWLTLDEDVDASANDVAMLLAAMTDADIVVAPMPIRDGSRLNVTTAARSVRTVENVRLFAIDHGGVALGAISRAAIVRMAEVYPDLIYTTEEGIEGIGLFLEAIIEHKYWGEDTMFCRRARFAGLRVEALLDARVVHMGRVTAIDDSFRDEEPWTMREGKLQTT